MTLTARSYASAALVVILALGLLPMGTAVAETSSKPGATKLTQADIDKALRNLDDLYRSTSSIARIEMTVHTPRRTRTVRMKAYSRGTKKALVVIEAPARDKGTATLRVDNNLWNYLPRIARTIRVPPSAMLSSWMGSDFTNDDLVRSSSYADDFDATLQGDSEDGKTVRIRLDAKKGTVGLWKRIDVTFTKDLQLPREARYYDRRMRLARTMVFEGVREFEGHRIPAQLTLTPVDEPGKKTVMRYLDIDFDADVPDSTFSLARLERSR